MTRERDPDHLIVSQPWRYDVVEFRFRKSPTNEFEPYIDLTLQFGDSVRRLRFFSPRDVRIEHGFWDTHGLAIIDVSARGMENIGVRVTNFENSDGCPEFWARAVIDLDQETAPG